MKLILIDNAVKITKSLLIFHNYISNYLPEYVKKSIDAVAGTEIRNLSITKSLFFSKIAMPKNILWLL